MESPKPSTSEAVLSEKQLAALVSLLGDEDPTVVETVRGRLTAGGQPAWQFLRTQRLHPDPAVRRRVRAMLNEQDAARYDSEFLAFILTHGEHFDLEEAVWKFTLTTYPDISVPAFRAQLDEWAERVREQLRHAASGETALTAINRVLFTDLNFRGNEKDYYSPANSYLNRVMDRRLGIPISLSVLYMFIARRVGLPVVGIGMPGHFLSRYQTPVEEFYIDAFHGGKLLSRIDCKRRLVDLAVEYDDRHLAPISPRRVLQRLIANLHLIYKERKRRPETERLERYLVALAR